MNRRHLTALALIAGTTLTVTTVSAASALSETVQQSPHHHPQSELVSGTIPNRAASPPSAPSQPEMISATSAAIAGRVSQEQRIENIKTLQTFAFEHQAALTAQANAQAARARAAEVAAAATPVATVSVGTPSISGLSGFLACVAFRESRDDPSAVNASSGAGGLFQFLPSTWASLGESGLPEDAPVDVQISAAERLYAEEGTAPWSGGGYSC